MTPLEFELLSAALLQSRERAECMSTNKLELIFRSAQHEQDVEAIANAIAAHIPAFDRERFLRASGVEL
jgi:hypothetical protein